MQVLYPIKRRTILAITHPTVFGQVYHTRKKKKEKRKIKEIFYSINKKLNKNSK
jgi:hypothetical protein